MPIKRVRKVCFAGAGTMGCYNSLISALLGAAQVLAALAGADFKEIDRSWMFNQNDTIGPFGMIDGVGLNLVLQRGVASHAGL